MLPTYHVYFNAFTLFTSRTPEDLTPKGQALPCLEMQWQFQTQLLEFSCQRLRKLFLATIFRSHWVTGILKSFGKFG